MLADCIDIDECATSTHDCNQACANTEGSFECVCRVGFRQYKALFSIYKRIMLPSKRPLYNYEKHIEYSAKSVNIILCRILNCSLRDIFLKTLKSEILAKMLMNVTTIVMF